MKPRLGLEMRQSVTQEVQLICSCCGQPYYPNKSWEDRVRAVLFGAEKYSICPLCTQQVPGYVFEDEAYRRRCRNQVERLQRLLDVETKTRPTKEALAKEALAKEALAKEAFAKEALAKEALAKEALAKEALAKEAFAKEAFAKEALAKEALAKEPSYDELKARVDELEKRINGTLPFKVSEKGAVSVYGLGRFPITLYFEQWRRLLDKAEELRDFLQANKAYLRLKEPR